MARPLMSSTSLLRLSTSERARKAELVFVDSIFERRPLYVAGEATDLEGASGTVHGAIATGIRVAEALRATG